MKIIINPKLKRGLIIFDDESQMKIFVEKLTNTQNISVELRSDDFTHYK